MKLLFLVLLFASTLVSPVHAEEYARPGSTKGQVTTDIVSPEAFQKDMNARITGRGEFIFPDGANQAIFVDKTCTSTLNMSVPFFKWNEALGDHEVLAIHFNYKVELYGEYRSDYAREGLYLYGVCEGVFNLAYE